MEQVFQVFDTTPRDGNQDPRVKLRGDRKIQLIKRIAEFGVPYIEAGYAASSPEEEALIRQANANSYGAKIVAFGSTLSPKKTPETDPSLQAIIRAGASVACIFGKTWKDHIKYQLDVTPERNLDLIRESVEFLKAQNRIGEVIYDAEHFFSGFRDDQAYAMETLKTARSAGADRVVLCDTKGGAMLADMDSAIEALYHEFNDSVPVGIHCHNDCGFAVANSMRFVEEVLQRQMGIPQVQGTVNGYGERAGNTDWLLVAMNLLFHRDLDAGIDPLEAYQFAKDISKLAGVGIPDNYPYWGANAFRHKAGMHWNAKKKGAGMSHIDAAQVGKEETQVLSDQVGSRNIVDLAEIFGYNMSHTDNRITKLQNVVKEMEQRGYDIDGNPTEQFLLVHYHLGSYSPFITDDGFDTNTKGRGVQLGRGGAINGNGIESRTHLMGRFLEDDYEIVATSHHGPVASQFDAIQKLIYEKTGHEWIKGLKLYGYKLHVAEDKGADSTVKVMIDFTDGREVWRTEGVSDDSMGASYNALKKGFEYVLLKHEIEKNASFTQPE